MRANNKNSEFKELMATTKVQFQERIAHLIEKYKQSEDYQQIKPVIVNENLQ